ncbi:hypothetical protein ACHAO7_011786 [Fusarium culmorum]
MAGQVKAKDKSDDYHSDSESEADDLFFTGQVEGEEGGSRLDSWVGDAYAREQQRGTGLKSWNGRKGNVAAWITNNIANWSETVGEGVKKRLTDEGNLLMEESSRCVLKLAKEPKMTRLEDAIETSVDMASDQTTEENDLSQADKLSERGIIKAIFPQIYEKTEPSQPVAQTGRPELIVGAHENSKRKNKPTTSLTQQDHELPSTTVVSKTNEASRHVTQFTPEENREIERVWNRFRDYRARQIMLWSALNQQDDQHSPPLKRIHSDPALNEFGNWFPQRQAVRERDERIA